MSEVLNVFVSPIVRSKVIVGNEVDVTDAKGNGVNRRGYFFASENFHNGLGDVTKNPAYAAGYALAAMGYDTTTLGFVEGESNRFTVTV